MFVPKPESQARILKCGLCAFQAHYAVQARRSRSVTRKRKREDSVPPTSLARSRSCSRTPRDVSGLRDVKVSLCHVQLITWWPLLLATWTSKAKPPHPSAVLWSRECRWGLAVLLYPKSHAWACSIGCPWSFAHRTPFSCGEQKHDVIWHQVVWA